MSHKLHYRKIMVALSVLLLSGTVSGLTDGQTWTTAGSYSYDVSDKSTIYVQLWGGTGGADSSRHGYSGYTDAWVDVSSLDTIYVYVGGGGDFNGGGYNCGGSPDTSRTPRGYGGGGASDISTQGGSVSDHLGTPEDPNRIAVAGGGGGEGYENGDVGGDGGGLQAEPGKINQDPGVTYVNSSEANQTSGNDFCYGHDGFGDASEGGGGGGWYGGGPVGFDAGGAGGSGYYNHSLIINGSSTKGGGFTTEGKDGKVEIDYVANAAPSINSISSANSIWSTGDSIDLEVNATDPEENMSDVKVDVYENGTKIVDAQDLTDGNDDSNWTASDVFTVDEGDVYYNLSITASDDKGVSDTFNTSKYIEQVDLSWNHPENPDGFRIYTNATEANSAVKTVSSSSTSYGSSALESGIYTQFNVTAYNAFGESDPLTGYLWS